MKYFFLLILFLSMETFGDSRDEIINKYARKLNIDPLLVKAIIYHESRGNKNAISPQGARGLMQVMPTTARFVGINPNLLFNEEFNIVAGIRYLAFLKAKFKGDIVKMVAGYNSGHASVIKYNGIPPYQETINYTKNVINTYKGGVVNIPSISTNKKVKTKIYHSALARKLSSPLTFEENDNNKGEL